MSESDLKRAAMQALNLLPGVVCYRNNTGSIRKSGRFIEYGLRSRPKQTGGSDLICCVDGLFVAPELKRPGEKPTAEQYAWGEELEQKGHGIWLWTDNLADLLRRIQEVQRTGRLA